MKNSQIFNPEILVENLIQSAVAGNLEEVERLLSEGTVNINDQNEFGQTSLIQLCKPSLIKALNPDFKPSYAVTSRSDMVKYFLQNGANPEITENNGYAPIHLAAMYGFDDVVKIFLDAKPDLISSEVAGWNPISLATHYNKYKTVKVLIESGADVNSTVNVKGKEYSITDIAAEIPNEESREKMLILITSQRTVFAVRTAVAEQLAEKFIVSGKIN